MEDDTTFIVGWREVPQGGRWEILWEATTKWRRYTTHQTEYAISSANLLFSCISIAGLFWQPMFFEYCGGSKSPATPPLALLIISLYGPAPHIGIARVQQSSSLVCSPPTNFIVVRRFRRAKHQRKRVVKLEAAIIARKRTRAPSENENNRNRDKS